MTDSVAKHPPWNGFHGELGSTAARILAGTDAPVIVVPREEKAKSDQPSQSWPPHASPGNPCWARARSTTSNRCHTENSGGKVAITIRSNGTERVDGFRQRPQRSRIT